MNQIEAEKIKTTIEELNKLYAPMVLFFDMFRNPKEDHDDNWFVTIVYHVSPDDWFTFVSLGFDYQAVSNKLSGFQFAMEAIQAYQEEYGNIKFSHSDLPLG
jgi:hypothetical protein